MRIMLIMCALLALFQLTGCGPSSVENQLSEVNQTSNSQLPNPDLLSVDGELFPLSTFFGVCAKRAGVLRATFSNGMPSSHFPTYAEITGDGGVLKITVGKFGMWPDTVFEEIPAKSLPRRIRIANVDNDKKVIVSDFESSGNNLVSIDYDEADIEAREAAIRLANSVVACHISIAPPKTNGER